MITFRKGAAAAFAAIGLALGTAAVTPAAAATGSTMGSWIGACHTWEDGVTAGGWCDGNGPNWTYQTVANCEKAGPTFWWTSGPTRWAGDRRQSYAYCSTRGGSIYAAWIYVFYNGQLQYQVRD